MKYLKRIEMPDQAHQSIALFYEVEKFKYSPVSEGLKKKVKSRSQHCDMFCKSSLKRIKLNKKSFVLYFRNPDRHLKLKFDTIEKQVNRLAGMVEHTLGQGLQVMKYYSKFLEKENE